jgi:hypothetical protein
MALPYIPTAQLGGKGQSGNYSQIIQPGYAIGTFDLWHYLGKNANGVSTYQKADGSTTASSTLTTDQRIKYVRSLNLFMAGATVSSIKTSTLTSWFVACMATKY